ncbi:exosortase [Thalassotalea aquiviva]|uniref:exosortase n=1 Tax=Thalassotalea aquiviva TaxID=3242415 RepID=UPI00352AAFD2
MTKNTYPLMAILSIFLLLLLFNLPIANNIWRYSFDDGTYSHAYLIPFICAYLFYHSRSSLRFRENIALGWGALFIICCLLLFITTNMQLSLGYWLALLLVFTSALLFLFNFDWRIVFSAGYLVFLLPVWGLISPPLQDLSVICVSFFLNLLHIPIYVEQQFITIPAGVFEIAEGCSGLRYIIVSLAISSLYSFLYLDKLKHAILFIGAAIIGALITNWIRITVIILIGEYTNMTSDLIEDHNSLGWFIFIPFMLLLFWYGNSFEQVPDENNNTGTSLSDRHGANFTLTSIIVGLFALSSSSLWALNFNQTSKTTVSQSSGHQLQPQVYFYSDVKTVEQTADNQQRIEQVYQFNCADLSCKPSFYLNSPIPANWQILEQRQVDDVLISKIINGSEIVHIKSFYQTDGLRFATSSAVKKFRLMNPLISRKDISFHWSVAYPDNLLGLQYDGK